MHFSLRSTNLVIRARHKDTQDIFELIPQQKFKDDLPAILIEGYAHWLNLSTRIIEIRPLEKLWEQSLDNWIISHGSRPYRVTKGCESLVDIRSPTWCMVSCRLECLDIPDNLIITSSPVDGVHFSESSSSHRLSVALPRYGLSFFVNDGGDLESRDFNDMVYDEDQHVGTLFGLVNKLVLRPKAQFEEDLFPKCILIPDGKPHLEQHGHQPRVTIKPHRSPRDDTVEGSCRLGNVLYHIYEMDNTLGCFTGISSLKSRLYLAELHTLTNNACRPDPLTGRTGVEEALSLTWLTGTRLTLGSRGEDLLYDVYSSRRGLVTWLPGTRRDLRIGEEDVWSSPRGPQTHVAIEKIRQGTSFDARLKQCRENVLQEAYLYPSEVTTQLPKEDQLHVLPSMKLEDHLVSYAATTVDWWSRWAPIVNNLSNWAKAWGDPIVGDDPSSQLEALRSNHTVPQLRINIYGLLGRGGSKGTSKRAARRIQLLFSLPTLVYSSKDQHATLQSTLEAFARQPRIHLENSPSFPQLGSEEDDEEDEGDDEEDDEDEEDEVEEDEVEVEEDGSEDEDEDDDESEDKDEINNNNDNTDDKDEDEDNLPQHLSNLYLMLMIRNSFTRFKGDPTSKPLPPNSESVTNALEPSSGWQITLDQLLRERPEPKLPFCHRLPLGNGNAGSNGSDSESPSKSDISKSRLGQVFPPSTGGEPPGYHTQYICRLQDSARLAFSKGAPASTCSGSAVKPSAEALWEHYKQSKALYTKGLEVVQKALEPREQIERILDRCGQWPRATPYTLFRCLASTSPIQPPHNWKTCLIALALLTLELQRARRLLQFASRNLEDAFFKELENEGGEGWLAAEHPDWVLIQVCILYPESSCLLKFVSQPSQLQGNFLIRRSQVDVAKEMIAPRSKENTVMQVNMGEGKSSVIIPICAAALANGCQLVRVIVPKALKAQMLQLLTNRLGGLVGMSIYHLTLSRFRSHSYVDVDVMGKIMNERGIVVMTPEDVLALKLVCVDKMIDTKVKADLSTTVRKSDYEHLLTERWLKSVSMIILRQ